MARIYGADIVFSSEVPAPATAELAAGCEGVSILGQGRADRELLRLWRELGVSYLSTRTVGYNHIDLDAARESYRRSLRELAGVLDLLLENTALFAAGTER